MRDMIKSLDDEGIQFVHVPMVHVLHVLRLWGGKVIPVLKGNTLLHITLTLGCYKMLSCHLIQYNIWWQLKVYNVEAHSCTWTISSLRMRWKLSWLTWGCLCGTGSLSEVITKRLETSERQKKACVWWKGNSELSLLSYWSLYPGFFLCSGSAKWEVNNPNYKGASLRVWDTWELLNKLL